MKKIAILLLLNILSIVFLNSCFQNNKKTNKSASNTTDSISVNNSTMLEDQLKTLSEEPVFEIQTSMGIIKVKLYKNTKLHRENFAKLALSGFYDNTLFHRVIDGFMIQGGDPLSKDPTKSKLYGTGGPDYTIPAEFFPEYKHIKGALAAARRGDISNPKRESSGSQFYLVQDASTCKQLDGAYTVFGETIEGLDVIDKIAKVKVDQRDRPYTDVKILGINLVEE